LDKPYSNYLTHREEKLYWELVDILRSPEVLKLITKSAVKEKVRKTKKLKQE